MENKLLLQRNIPRTVTVHITEDIAFNLDKMNKVTASVLDKLGCPGCHSGRILDFQIIENFVVNPKTLEVNQVTLGSP